MTVLDVKGVSKRFGGLHIAINNAGIGGDPACLLSPLISSHPVGHHQQRSAIEIAPDDIVVLILLAVQTDMRAGDDRNLLSGISVVMVSAVGH